MYRFQSPTEKLEHDIHFLTFQQARANVRTQRLQGRNDELENRVRWMLWWLGALTVACVIVIVVVIFLCATTS